MPEDGERNRRYTELSKWVVRYLTHKYEVVLAGAGKDESELDLYNHALNVIRAVDRLADAAYRNEPDLIDLAAVSVELIIIADDIQASKEQASGGSDAQRAYDNLNFLYQNAAVKWFVSDALGGVTNLINIVAVTLPHEIGVAAGGSGFTPYWRFRAGERVSKDDPRITGDAKNRLDMPESDDCVLVMADSNILNRRCKTVDEAYKIAVVQMIGYYELEQDF